LRIAVGPGLANARALVEDLRAGRERYDFVEVMACPGGCAGGAGQPVALDGAVRRKRAECLRRLDAGMDLRLPAENPAVTKAYQDRLGQPNSAEAHRLLHTHYTTRRRMRGDGIALTEAGEGRIPVSVCVGTSCYLRGSQKLLQELLEHVEDQELGQTVSLQATFCMEGCDRGPTVRVAGQVLHRADLGSVKALLARAMDGELDPCEAGHGCH
jgi:NADH-quinone oxidoreductase subunit G